jgi:hypothetical protein
MPSNEPGTFEQGQKQHADAAKTANGRLSFCLTGRLYECRKIHLFNASGQLIPPINSLALDTTTTALSRRSGTFASLSDTVGFIRDLPHEY